MRTFFALILILSITASAQSPTDIAKPDNKPSHPPNQTLEQFNKELRIALIKQDIVALAFLVEFPLRVNDDGGTISLDNPAALKTHFNEVFTPAVRKAILDSKEDGRTSNDFGIGYGFGVIWVKQTGRGNYAIQVVNRDAVIPGPRASRDQSKLEYVCTTSTHRIAIETTPDGNLRYRSWHLPRPITSAPDLTILRGKQTFEGTGLCAEPIYIFKNGDTTYKLSGRLGCAPDAPELATGDIEITSSRFPADQTHAWCF